LKLKHPDGTTEEVSVGKATTVFLDGRTGSLSDLTAGQEIRAAFEPGEGSKAEWIELAK
jgi:hypothetical protein